MPPESSPPAAPSAVTDFEFVGIVDHSLDAQHAAVLVVHLDPVALHPVFHPGPGPATLPLVQDLAREAAMEFPAEEGQHVLGAQGEHYEGPKLTPYQTLAARVRLPSGRFYGAPMLK